MRRLLVGLLAFGAAGCDCGPGTRKNSPTLEVIAPDGTLDRMNVDFGFVQVNIKGVQKVRVRNSGNAQLSITEATAMPAQFGIDDPRPIEIAAGDETMLSFTFTPTVPDQRITGTMTFTTNDSAHATYTLQLAGQGITAVAKPFPTMLAFGDVYVGASKALTLTLTNAGGNALPVIGAMIAGGPAGVSGDFTTLTNASIPAGGSETVTVTFAPTAAMTGPISGALVIQIDAASGGNVTVPITGRATQALPRMCFKFDDQPMETCTDQITNNLNLSFGAQCDNHIYTCAGATAQRTGKLYFRNEGNIPLPYSVRYRPYIYTSSRCGADAGADLSDFVFSNVAVPDGGAPAELNVATTTLPSAETDPKPWETAPITVTYRASSRCLAEGADQAQVLWTRQDPPTTMPARLPATLFATLTGNSLLPNAKPIPVNLGQAMSPAPAPTQITLELVLNQGQAPLTLTSVELWEELPAFLPDGGSYDGGGPEGGILSMCNPSSPVYADSDCARFQWVPNESPARYLPVTLDGGATAQNPSKTVVGKMSVGCLADGGSCPPAATRYKVIAMVNTSDPYASRVAVPIIAIVRFVP